MPTSQDQPLRREFYGPPPYPEEGRLIDLSDMQGVDPFAFAPPTMDIGVFTPGVGFIPTDSFREALRLGGWSQVRCMESPPSPENVRRGCKHLTWQNGWHRIMGVVCCQCGAEGMLSKSTSNNWVFVTEEEYNSLLGTSTSGPLGKEGQSGRG